MTTARRDPIRAKHLAARRKHLAAVVATLEAGEALEMMERFYVLDILRALIEGRDVREYFGIPPKRGAPRSTAGLRKWIAVDYWRLRLGAPPHPDKVARHEVAARWGISESSVWKIARPQRAAVAAVALSIDAGTLDSTLETLIPEYRRLTTPNRK